MRRVWTISTLAWTAIILAITLSPEQPTDGGWVRDSLAWLAERGLPAWVTYDVIEVAANVVLFIPFGLFLALCLRGSSSAVGAYRDPTLFIWPTVLALSLSLTIEFTQATFLPARFATVSDLAANTAGALLGASLAVITARPRALPR